MNSEFRIMRIGGIDIKVGWTLLIIGTFISLSLATGYFPTLLPGWGSPAYLTAALLSFIGLYASMLLHELAHAFVAKKQGLTVKSIVLNLFGSASNFKEESPNSRAEFWRAVVGPLTNLGLAGVFFGVANLPAPSNPLISAIALYLLGINFLLGVFNLLPAYPLDGGRVLQALVWGRTKNQLKANRVVTRVGRGFGWVFIGLGFCLIALGDLFDGLWLMLLGWFLTSSARVSSTQSVARPSLQGVKVSLVMRDGDPILSPQTPLKVAAQAFFGVERGRVLSVVEQGYLLGTLSLAQLRKISPAERVQMRVEKVMTRRGSLLALRSEDDLQSSMKTLAAKPVVYAAVIGEGGQFAGLLYLRDIPRLLEMQPLLTPIDPKVGPPTLPPTITIKNQDHADTTDDNVVSPPQPQKWIK
jgi:Zn-dependent protease